jgi:membrane-bound lytic murein transglycosylase F
MMLAVIAPLALVAALAVNAPPPRAPAHYIPTRFDAEIRAAAQRHLPGWDWRWWKAQVWVESAMNPAAVSPAGARGLAQLMPGTHRELSAALRAGMASPHDVVYSLNAGAFYMARLRASWTAERPEDERRRLAQASYNAGLGNVLKAQRRCKAETASPCRAWSDVAPHLPAITGRHSAETLAYVDRIERTFHRLSL